MYRYKVDVTRIVDGDTVDVDIDLGFKITMKKQRVRLMGIDTPESRTRDLEEKFYGKQAKKFLTSLLEETEVQLVVHDKGKFGRIIGELFIIEKHAEGHPVFEINTEKSVNQLMMDNYHAVPYMGQSKDDTIKGHMMNRAALNEQGIKYSTRLN